MPDALSLNPPPSAESLAAAEADPRTLAETLATLPEPVLAQLIEMMSICGGMSQDEKQAASVLLGEMALQVAVNGAEDHLLTGQLLIQAGQLVTLTFRLANGEEVA